ncbi:HlyD family type I secretion periplasmic adaptor subunit [Marinomonas fungiae]|uniref:Membrane fusion protein (MFP) family protein n=1 Tax=Marinomonas fungiae TaxID=1137284 RepID=A0A0K6II51_9GAMM|nr:HlyD family type I secretion periplasmic adaptor subunit [Marinomonas fungiae]CUB02785.1 type I secretion membrane fusion protein, HlyD family [Marinomonas fungiae]
MTKQTEQDSDNNAKGPNTDDKSGQALAKIQTVKKSAEEINIAKAAATQPSEPVMEDVEVPSNDGRYIKFGVIFLLLTLGTFTLWGTTAPLNSALIAPGEVVVDSYRKTIQHYEGGIVEKIFVRNGDVVKTGDPLIQLENAQFQAQLENSYKQLQITRAELERLNAEQNFQQEVTFSETLQKAAQSDTDVADALKQQSNLLDARISAYQQEANSLETRLEQTDEQVNGMDAQIAGRNQQLKLLQEEEEAYTTLYNEGLGDNNRARELNRSIISTQNEINKLKSDMARLKIQNTETELQIATRKQDFLKDVGDRLKQTQATYFDLQEKYQVAQDRVERSIVRAPEDGTIVDMKVHTIGSVANSGQPLMDLVPVEDSFVVESRVMTNDINDIHVGQLADIRFSAFNASLTKVIQGEVINVSADRLQQQEDQAPYYLARIKVTDQGSQDMTNDDMKLIPGMPAEVMIRRGERTLFSYIIKPLKDSFARSLKEK